MWCPVILILTRDNVGGVNDFAAGPLYGFTILFSFPAPAAFSFPLSGEIDDWTPSMKKKVEFFGTKAAKLVSKWSNLNAPGIETPVSHSLLAESLFLLLPLSGVIDR